MKPYIIFLLLWVLFIFSLAFFLVWFRPELG